MDQRLTHDSTSYSYLGAIVVMFNQGVTVFYSQNYLG